MGLESAWVSGIWAGGLGGSMGTGVSAGLYGVGLEDASRDGVGYVGVIVFSNRVMSWVYTLPFGAKN